MVSLVPSWPIFPLLFWLFYNPHSLKALQKFFRILNFYRWRMCFKFFLPGSYCWSHLQRHPLSHWSSSFLTVLPDCTYCPVYLCVLHTVCGFLHLLTVSSLDPEGPWGQVSCRTGCCSFLLSVFNASQFVDTVEYLFNSIIARGI